MAPEVGIRRRGNFISVIKLPCKPVMAISSASSPVTSFFGGCRSLMRNWWTHFPYRQLLLLFLIDFSPGFFGVGRSFQRSGVDATPILMPLVNRGVISRRVHQPRSCLGRSGEEGVCMFAWDCMKANGSHMDICVEGFYFRSCCHLPEGTSIEDIMLGSGGQAENTTRRSTTTKPWTSTTSRPWISTTSRPRTTTTSKPRTSTTTTKRPRPPSSTQTTTTTTSTTPQTQTFGIPLLIDPTPGSGWIPLPIMDENHLVAVKPPPSEFSGERQPPSSPPSPDEAVTAGGTTPSSATTTSSSTTTQGLSNEVGIERETSSQAPSTAPTSASPPAPAQTSPPPDATSATTRQPPKPSLPVDIQPATEEAVIRPSILPNATTIVEPHLPDLSLPHAVAAATTTPRTPPVTHNVLDGTMGTPLLETADGGFYTGAHTSSPSPPPSQHLHPQVAFETGGSKRPSPFGSDVTEKTAEAESHHTSEKPPQGSLSTWFSVVPVESSSTTTMTPQIIIEHQQQQSSTAASVPESSVSSQVSSAIPSQTTKSPVKGSPDDGQDKQPPSTSTIIVQTEASPSSSMTTPQPGDADTSSDDSVQLPVTGSSENASSPASSMESLIPTTSTEHIVKGDAGASAAPSPAGPSDIQHEHSTSLPDANVEDQNSIEDSGVKKTTEALLPTIPYEPPSSSPAAVLTSSTPGKPVSNITEATTAAPTTILVVEEHSATTTTMQVTSPSTSSTTTTTSAAPATTTTETTTTTPEPTTTSSTTMTTTTTTATTASTTSPTTTTTTEATTTTASTSASPNTTLSTTTTTQPTTTTAVSSSTSSSSDARQICGRQYYPTSRIVGGNRAEYGEWPWQVSLRQWRTAAFLHKCGAALLNENWAITAAHCVENVPPEDIMLRLGEYDLASEKEPYGYVERRVQIIASHPNFDPRTFEYDLALLRFYEPVQFQPNIIPICLPEDDRNFLGSSGYVTGWGRLYEDGPLPSVMQEVRVPVVNNSLCEVMYRRAGYNEHIPNIFLCAGYAKGGLDSCEGDSGGPLVIQRDDSRWLLAGIISWGIGCAEPNQPGVYTRISEFRHWINQIIVF